jgi:superfamily I DNA and RNA helicase
MSGAPSKPWEDNETIDLTGGDRFVDSRSSRKKSIVIVRDDYEEEEVEKSLSSAISSKKPSSKFISSSTSTPMSPKIEAESRQFLALTGLTPSIEQAAVVKALIEGQHASVNAVAGSGKTTSVIMLAAYLHAESRGRRILLLT